VVGVVAICVGVERDREPGLAGVEQMAKPRVVFLRGAEAAYWRIVTALPRYIVG